MIRLGPHIDRWTELVERMLLDVWPTAPSDQVAWTLAQIAVESSGNPEAISASGAMGLMQLMPETAAEMNVAHPLDPADNVRGGLRYLRRLYDRLEADIPSVEQRRHLALAGYVGGLAYILRALALARADGEPCWWSWKHTRLYLMHRDCKVGGMYPRYHDIWAYVSRIEALATGGGGA